MEDNDTKNAETDAKANRAKQADKKSSKRKKWPLRRYWHHANRRTQVKWVAEGIVILTGLGVLGVYLWDHFQREEQFFTEHRPRVIVSRPPELLGTFNCQVTKREIYLHAGVTHIWVKNIRKGDAHGAFALGPEFKPVPEKKLGDPFYDDPPPIEEQTCMMKVEPKMSPFPVHGGEEVEVNLRQSAGSISLFKGTHAIIGFGGPQDENKVFPGENPAERIPVDNDTLFQLYAPICVYYFDESGKRYGSCRTYRFIPNGASQYAFSCSQTPLSGTFEATMFGYCEN